MATKRKHDDSPPPDASRSAPENGTACTSPVAENYPRKRIAIACNVCRFRKTRCDAQKPSCGFCTDLGIECTYRKPTMGDRSKATGPPSEALENIERRLSEVESRVDATEQHLLARNDVVISPNTSHHSEMLPPREPPSRRSSVNRLGADYLTSTNTALNGSVETPAAYDFAYRQTATESQTARPSLLTFRAPSYIHVDSWDFTGEFYDDEILAGEQLSDQLDALLDQPVDLSKRTIRQLQQSFVENFLRWIPIFDQQTCVNAVEQAYLENFVGTSPPTCLTFFLLATGAITADKDENTESTLPGLDYLARGCHILDRLSLRTGNIMVLQCRVLQASYFKFAIRPMQTWNSITQAGRDCMHICSSRMRDRLSLADQEAFNRAFWATSTIIHELEATMKMFPVGIRQFHEMVPLPQFEEEDSGFYYFLAQISLRKFLTQSLEVVGYHSGRVIYAPVVTRELRNQVREWYDHLPAVVRFPLDATQVFDSRKSFLRGQYVALFVVLGWPSVLKIMEHGTGEGAPFDPTTIATMKEQAAGCIRGCCLYLSVADEQLMGRAMGTHFSIWAAFAMFATLIITFNCQALSFVEETKQERHIRNAYEVLKPWDHLPLIRRGLGQARTLMQHAGLFDGTPDYSVTRSNLVTPALAELDWYSPRSQSGPKT